MTAELLRNVANNISPMIQMKEEVGSDHSEDDKRPILDLKVWVEQEENGGRKIKHSFYRKPMTSRRKFLERSAFPTPSTRSILVEETLRRFRNCSPETLWSEKAKYLTEFALELKTAGHVERFRKVILEKAVARYQRELVEHMEGKKDLYRSREERLRQLEERGGRAERDDWFKGGSRKCTAVLKVPMTTDGELKKTIDQVIQKTRAPTGVNTRTQKAGGRSTKACLFR